MELIKIVNARNALNELSEKEAGSQLSYWMTKFIVKTEGEHSFYATEVRKIFDKYAEKKEDGTIVIPNDKIGEFNAEVDKLGQTDVEDPNIKFKLSAFTTDLKLSMKQMYPLLDFIDEEK